MMIEVKWFISYEVYCQVES